MAVSQKSDEAPIRTDEQIAKLADMSRDMVRKIKAERLFFLPEPVERPRGPRG